MIVVACLILQLVMFSEDYIIPSAPNFIEGIQVYQMYPSLAPFIVLQNFLLFVPSITVKRFLPLVLFPMYFPSSTVIKVCCD